MVDLQVLLSTISGVSQGLKDIKDVYELVPKPFIGSKKRLDELEQKIYTVSTKVINLQKEAKQGFSDIRNLKNSVDAYSDLVKDYSDLVKIYTDLVANVRTARARTDKLSELYTWLKDDLTTREYQFLKMWVNQTNEEYGRIGREINQLSTLEVNLNISEKGEIKAHLEQIDRQFIKMSNTNEQDTQAIINILKEISSEYSLLEKNIQDLLLRILEQMKASSENLKTSSHQVKFDGQT